MGNLTQEPALDVRSDPPPPQGMVLGTRCCGWVISSPPPRVCSREGGEAVPRTRGPWPGGPEAHGPETQKPSTPSVSENFLFSDPRDPESEP